MSNIIPISASFHPAITLICLVTSSTFSTWKSFLNTQVQKPKQTLSPLFSGTFVFHSWFRAKPWSLLWLLYSKGFLKRRASKGIFQTVVLIFKNKKALAKAVWIMRVNEFCRVKYSCVQRSTCDRLLGKLLFTVSLFNAALTVRGMRCLGLILEAEM